MFCIYGFSMFPVVTSNHYLKLINQLIIAVMREVLCSPWGTDWILKHSVLSIIRAGGGGDARIIEKHGLCELYILYTDRSFW
jgi:hypothetical protein